jgi:hypothetical protein
MLISIAVKLISACIPDFFYDLCLSVPEDNHAGLILVADKRFLRSGKEQNRHAVSVHVHGSAAGIRPFSFHCFFPL